MESTNNVTKEQIWGAISLMESEDLATVWNFITDVFTVSDKKWTGIREVAPDNFDLAMIEEIKTNPDCQTFIPAEDVWKELGITQTEK